MTQSRSSRRHEGGQAIVLIAIMLAVLIGMVAIAVDGARGYSLRRDLQAAVDAAALAAGDRLQQTGSYTSAEQAAVNEFGIDLRLYTAPVCSPYAPPGAAPVTVRCTYPDATALTENVSALGPQGTSFTLTASRLLQLNFARVLTNGVNPTIGGASTSDVNNLRYTPAVGALSQAGCRGVGGSAISVAGGTLDVNGDVVSSGGIVVSGGRMVVAGDVYARCQSAVSSTSTVCYPSGAATPCIYPDVAGATRSGFRLVDPKFPAPAVTGGGQPTPGGNVELSPGTYAFNPSIGSGRCYFLDPGVYRFPGGYTSSGGFVSNELKPPAEPMVGDNQRYASQQFWNTNGVNCAGDVEISTLGGGPQIGSWGFEVTSVRLDTYGGVSFTRESAPSICESQRMHLFQTVQVLVSNVPGAQSYNIYVSPNGCSGPFGLAFTLPVSGGVSNEDTSGCPFGGMRRGGATCSLGSETLTFLSVLLLSIPLPNIFAIPLTPGAYPPDGETAPLAAGLPNQDPGRGVPPAGDRANENQCATNLGAAMSCPGGVTPGAVAFSVPAGGCVNETNASDNYVFSGYQYNWMALYEPGAGNPPANTCANRLGAAANSAIVGFVYMPSATVMISSSGTFASAGMGGLLASQVTFTSTPTITYSSAYAPVPPASRLTG